MKDYDQGYTQVYTGNGKGKTTASLGLAFRAAGAGKKVLFSQFLKGQKHSESKAMKRFDDLITLKQYGKGSFIKGVPCKEDQELATKGFEETKTAIENNEYDIVVMDEINLAIYYKMVSVKELLNLIENKPKKMELIITGRKVEKEIIEAADLVTEMKEIKHYYKQGVMARVGIEK